MRLFGALVDRHAAHLDRIDRSFDDYDRNFDRNFDRLDDVFDRRTSSICDLDFDSIVPNPTHFRFHPDVEMRALNCCDYVCVDHVMMMTSFVVVVVGVAETLRSLPLHVTFVEVHPKTGKALEYRTRYNNPLPLIIVFVFS